MMLFVFVWLLRFLSNQLLSVCCITTRLNDLKEVFSRASWDTVDFNHDDIELPCMVTVERLFFSAVNFVVPTVK